jgi:large subunit ribosomal protein L5
MTTLKEQYDTVAAELQQQWGKKNRYEVPRLVRINVNVGTGRNKDESGYTDMVVDSLTQITGQKPVVTKARMSIASFKLREGMDVGVTVTLRGRRMEDFFYRLVHIVLPRIRDFRGLSKKSFDGRGNYSLGITEHTVFPEISYEDVAKAHPLQIAIVTDTDSDEEAAELFTKLGFPFTEDR